MAQSQPTKDIFDMLMDEAQSDQYSCAERLMLASHLVKDARAAQYNPQQRERLLGRARHIIRTVDKELAREIVNSATRP